MTDRKKANSNDADIGEDSGTAEAGDKLSAADTPEDSFARLKSKVSEQKERIEALARGREEGMGTISELRAELALVAAERDKLRKQLTELESMQIDTMTLIDKDGVDETDPHYSELPSIEELMSTFGNDDESEVPSSQTGERRDSESGEPSGEYQEMISPNLIVLGSGREKIGDATERFLVLLQPGNHTKCALDEDLLTIGRSESADIQIDGDFISRIHARILRIGKQTYIKDAGSKNGTWVNGEPVSRQALKHGDLIRIGSAHFRLVDSASADPDAK